MEKWYEGKTTEEILAIMSRTAHEAVVHAKRNNFKESEAVENDFNIGFRQVIPAIVDMKTMYWEFRHNNNVYDTWDKLQSDLWAVKNGMENDIYLAYQKFYPQEC